MRLGLFIGVLTASFKTNILRHFVGYLASNFLDYFSSFFFPCGVAAQRGPWPPHFWGFLITHNDAPQSVGLLWTSDQLVAKTSTWQHTTLTKDNPCPRWDSNPRSQQASGRRPTPYTAQLLGPAYFSSVSRWILSMLSGVSGLIMSTFHWTSHGECSQYLLPVIF